MSACAVLCCAVLAVRRSGWMVVLCREVENFEPSIYTVMVFEEEEEVICFLKNLYSVSIFILHMAMVCSPSFVFWKVLLHKNEYAM